jgi:hypothetical protein
MSRLTFARNPSGDFDFSESKCARINAALADKCGQREPRIPVTLKRAADSTFVKRCHLRADRMGVAFHVAASFEVRECPELAKFTRGIAVPDGEDADVGITE